MGEGDTKRLLWLTQGTSSKLPSQRLRVLEMVPLLDKFFNQQLLPAPGSLRGLWRIRRQIKSADIVILQKEPIPVATLMLLRSLAKRLVYDFDDAVYLRHLSNGSCRPSAKRERRFRAICRSVDLVFAGNAVLAQEAHRCGAKRVEILPTAVVLPKMAAVPSLGGATVRLGWIGTDVNLPYLLAMENTFLALKEEGLIFSLEVMAGSQPAFSAFKDFNFTPWSPGNEEAFLASLDVGLMPLADNAHTRGKCAYKALQYMSLGKPVVVSDVGVNAEWTSGAGFACKTDEDARLALRQLISSPAMREKMGKHGRWRTENEFSREIIAEKLRKSFDFELV